MLNVCEKNVSEAKLDPAPARNKLVHKAFGEGPLGLGAGRDKEAVGAADDHCG